MTDYALLISPIARGAFFGETDAVVLAELGGVSGVEAGAVETQGGLSFVRLTCAPEQIKSLLRLSFAQGLFKVSAAGWNPVDADDGFLLHPDFVSGEKYRGKTNETLTQLLMNLALQEARTAHVPSRLLDPMCGRGTSLFWAMRYGLSATGIEQDPAALAEVRRGLKKWTKLHRQKHKLAEGWVQKTNKKGVGKFLDFMAEGQVVRLVTGDTVNARELAGRKPFELLITDIPYGVQHMGGKDGKRSPLEVLKAAAAGWVSAMAVGGVMAIAYNRNIPKRDEMLEVFDGLGLEVIERNVAHRMSESILRDVLLLRKEA